MCVPFDTAISFLAEPVGGFLYHLKQEEKNHVCEIRCRAEQPVILRTTEGFVFLDEKGSVSSAIPLSPVSMNSFQIQESFQRLCRDSAYAYQEEIRNGFLTYLGGHRVGICGTAVAENGRIQHIRDISSLNIRIAKESFRIALPILDALGDRIGSGVLIAGKSGCGKTTVLRDICRILASPDRNRRYRLAVIDERGELAGVFQGVVQMDVGVCSDVLDRYPKAQGIQQAVRCLSPDIVVCDEIGTEEEVRELLGAFNAGVSVIATIHAGNAEELRNRPQFQMLAKSGAVRTVVFLDSSVSFGAVSEILDIHELVP